MNYRAILATLCLLAAYPITAHARFECGPQQDPEQCNEMNRWITPEQVRERSQSVASHQYCNGTISDAQCDRKRTLAIDTGCVTPEYAQFLRGINVGVGNGVAPACDITSLDPPRSILIGFCVCGCFSEDTALLSVTPDGNTQWTAAKVLFAESPKAPLVTLSDASTSVNRLVTTQSQFTPIVGKDQEKQIFHFKTSQGRVLTLTGNHAVLLYSGKLVEAAEVTMRDKFVSPMGGAVDIVGIKSETKVLDTHNVSVNVHSRNPLLHIIFAEGVAIGDISFQNGLASEVGRIALRSRDSGAIRGR